MKYKELESDIVDKSKIKDNGMGKTIGWNTSGRFFPAHGYHCVAFRDQPERYVLALYERLRQSHIQ